MAHRKHGLGRRECLALAAAPIPVVRVGFGRTSPGGRWPTNPPLPIVHA
jgi:hypothetical protein